MERGGPRAAGRLIDDEAARLDRLVRGVLDLSRIEAGAVRARLGAARPARRSSNRRSARTGLAADIGVSIADDLPPVLVDDVLVDVDPREPPGQRVDPCRTRRADRGCRPAAMDPTGSSSRRGRWAGRAAGRLPRLFERFYRRSPFRRGRPARPGDRSVGRARPHRGDGRHGDARAATRRARGRRSLRAAAAPLDERA